MNYIRVCNWREYQHYKDRNPDWIKLHGEILGKPVWVMQADATKLLAVTIMLLAARYDNRIPAEPEFVKRVAHLQQEPDFSPLIKLQFIEIIDDHDNLVQSASEVLAVASKTHQTASLEKERELEKEKEKESKPSDAAKAPRGGNRKMADAAAQTRHARIQGMVMTAYSERNGGAQCPWDASEGSNLSKLLKSTPNWPDSQIAQCLDHMYRSEGFPAGTRPREFLCSLPKYLRGPLDRFNKLITDDGGNASVSRSQQRQDEGIDNIGKALARYQGSSD